MEGDVQPPLLRPPARVRRRAFARAHQHRLLPDELRDRDAPRSVPEPPVAPDLAHRVRGPHGGVALPLLPPRRAARVVRAPRERPRGARRDDGAHGGAAAADRRHPKHPPRAADRGGAGGGARRAAEDR